MYGEMAAAAAGDRSWSNRQSEWEAAFESATRFILLSGFDDQTKRHLLHEAAATRIAGEVCKWNRPVSEICNRLAAEFRWEVRHR